MLPNKLKNRLLNINRPACASAISCWLKVSPNPSNVKNRMYDSIYLEHLNTYPLVKRILALDHNQVFINSLADRDAILSSGHLNYMDDGLYISQENIENSKSKNGYGIMIGKNESYFEGYWTDNAKNGKGILITKDG